MGFSWIWDLGFGREEIPVKLEGAAESVSEEGCLGGGRKLKREEEEDDLGGGRVGKREEEDEVVLDGIGCWWSSSSSEEA